MAVGGKPHLSPHLVFICQASRFVIVDRSLFDKFLVGQSEPWMVLSVGSGQIFESRPIKVLEYKHPEVSVVTASYTVRLDLREGSAYRVFPNGTEHEFKGGLDLADARQGWIPLKAGQPQVKPPDSKTTPNT